MKKFIALLSFLPVLAWASVAEYIVFADPYVRAMPPGQKNTAAYVEIGYEDGRPAKIVSAYTPIAKQTQLHTVEIVKDVAKMQQVSGIALKAGGTTELQPGGYHVMLLGLDKTLEPDETVPMVFVYDDGSWTAMDFVVRDIRKN